MTKLQYRRDRQGFVDDGFRPAGTFPLTEHAALVGCPVRRIVRVETEAESAAADWPPLAECRARLQQAITDAVAEGAVGLKVDFEVDDALVRMLESKGPFVLDVMVPYQEHVLPMIPSGRTVHDMIKS